MTYLKRILARAGEVPALRRLAQTPAANAVLDTGPLLMCTLSILGREMFGAGLGLAVQHMPGTLDVAEIDDVPGSPKPPAQIPSVLPGTIQERRLPKLPVSRSNSGLA